jgi:transcriptional regulator with XRE-family HTH domain
MVLFGVTVAGEVHATVGSGRQAVARLRGNASASQSSSDPPYRGVMNQVDHRTLVRDFLVSRRERITPDQAGLPAYGGAHRRVKGLRREEVALLAGVSIDYYVRMERGNLAGASDQVLRGVADALQLDEAEREHLVALARAAGPAPRRTRTRPALVRPVVQQVLDAMTDAPSWVRNGRHDILAVNSLARALYSSVLESAVAGATDKRPANTTRFMFLDPAARDFFMDYERMAADAAAMLRLEAGRSPHDADLHSLVGELSTQSDLFRRHWASQNVKFHRSGRKRLRHPAVGELDLNFEAMDLPSEPELRLNVYTADPGTPTADGLRLLASWAATTAPRRREERAW